MKNNQATWDELDFEGPQIKSKEVSRRQHHLFLRGIA